MSKSDPQDDKSPSNGGPDWTSYVRYFCRACGVECINDYRTSRARYEECESCHRVAQLDQEPVDLEAGRVRLGSPISRQAVDLVCGEFQASERPERAQDGQKPGTARSAARPECSSFQARDGSEVPYTSTAIGDAHVRLSHRRGNDE